MKDAVATMGNLLPDDAAGRDAVHVAVFSAHSGVRLFPGQDVAIVRDDGRDAEVNPAAGPLIGVVDPFLKTPAMPGDRFWVYLYPRTITALAHRWSHPAFEDVASVYVPPSSKLESEKWLKDFCDQYSNVDYNFDMRVALQGIFDGCNTGDEYLTVYGSDEKGSLPSELWGHCSVVFGKPVPADKPTYFSCSC